MAAGPPPGLVEANRAVDAVTVIGDEGTNPLA